MAIELAKNPFTPLFGVVPPFMAGREELMRDLMSAFEQEGWNPNLSSIISGARGTGKTALLSYVSEEAEAHGWISVNSTASRGLLDDILERAAIAAREFLDGSDGRRLRAVSIGQLVGFEWENETPRAGNWRTQMSALLDQLQEHDTGLLITVDEVKVDLDEMKHLAIVYQHFVRERRKVALLMAGLPYSISNLLNDNDVSFLRRARRHQLGRIPDNEIRDALNLTIVQAGRTIEPDALQHAVDAVDGFPYMMQLVGYRIWAERPQHARIDLADVEHGVKLARREMAEGILENTYRELSDGDLRFLGAMLMDDRDSKLSDVAERMGVKSNYASQYKRRLLAQGIIGESGRGYVRFDMPVFRDFLQEHLEEL